MELWEVVWQSWLQGPKPIPETVQPQEPGTKDFACSDDFEHAKTQYDAYLELHARMSAIWADFDSAFDCFVEFLLAVPANVGVDAMSWKRASRDSMG